MLLMKQVRKLSLQNLPGRRKDTDPQIIRIRISFVLLWGSACLLWKERRICEKRVYKQRGIPAVISEFMCWHDVYAERLWIEEG